VPDHGREYLPALSRLLPAYKRLSTFIDLVEIAAARMERVVGFFV
jgi:hypothetical protein